MIVQGSWPHVVFRIHRAAVFVPRSVGLDICGSGICSKFELLFSRNQTSDAYLQQRWTDSFFCFVRLFRLGYATGASVSNTRAGRILPRVHGFVFWMGPFHVSARERFLLQHGSSVGGNRCSLFRPDRICCCARLHRLSGFCFLVEVGCVLSCFLRIFGTAADQRELFVLFFLPTDLLGGCGQGRNPLNSFVLSWVSACDKLNFRAGLCVTMVAVCSSLLFCCCLHGILNSCRVVRSVFSGALRQCVGPSCCAQYVVSSVALLVQCCCVVVAVLSSTLCVQCVIVTFGGALLVLFPQVRCVCSVMGVLLRCTCMSFDSALLFRRSVVRRHCCSVQCAASFVCACVMR